MLDYSLNCERIRFNTTDRHHAMKTYIRFTLGLLGVGFLSACDASPQVEQIRQSGFVYCGQAAPSTFNPQLVDSGITAEALSPQIYDRLVTLHPITHRPEPSLARDWTISDNGKTYTFYLRDDVPFQTTHWFTPTRLLNAKDVVFSFQRILNSDNPYHQVNGNHYPWFTGIDFQNMVQSVTALDAHTVQFKLNNANYAFLSDIATSHAVILSQEYAQQLAAEDKKSRLDRYPVGTGPFYLEHYKSGDWIRLKRNDAYWGEKAKMKQVVFDVSKRGTGTLAKLLRQECDVLNSPISSQIPIIEDTDTLHLTATPAMNVAFVAINTQRAVVNNPRVRHALNLAINRQNILDSVYYGRGVRADTLLPPSSWAYRRDSVTIRYDRNYALALLRDADVATGTRLTMFVPLEPRAYNPSPRKTAELIKSNLADIGIDLDIITDKEMQKPSRAQLDNIDLLLTGWIGDSGEPDNFLRPLLSCEGKVAGINISHWCNEDFDVLLDLALETEHFRYRRNIYFQAQNIINQDFPVIPLAHGMQYRVNDVSLQGFINSPFNAQPFNLVERVN